MSHQHKQEESAGATVVAFSICRDEAEEHYIQGDLAGMAHLLEQALATASTAHLIAQRRRGAHPVLGDRINCLQIEALDRLVQSAGEAEVAAERALRDSVAMTPLLSRSYKPKAHVVS